MGGVVSFVKDHWTLFVEIIIIIIKYIYGRREEERAYRNDPYADTKVRDCYGFCA